LSDRLEDLELNSLVRQVGGFVATFSTGGYGANASSEAEKTPKRSPAKTNPDSTSSTGSAAAPQQGSVEAEAGAIPPLQPQLIESNEALQALVQRLMDCTDPKAPIAVDTETTDLNPFKAELVGVGVCWGEANDALAYIPIGHKPPSELSEATPPQQLPLETVLMALSPWLASPQHPKALQNAKYDRLILLRHGLTLNGVVIDTLLADYLRDAAAKHGLDLMSEREFGFRPTTYGDLVGKKQTFADVAIEPASLYCGMDVHVTRRLALQLRQTLQAMGPPVTASLEGVEQPLEPVLAQMEATGIRIDVPYLKTLSDELGSTLNRLETDAKQVAEVDFNLASPKQLGELLFDTLGLDRKKSRRTKTGFSTDATVLEKLENDHPVVPLVLEHRVLSKLKSTYVDALPQLVEAETGRVHTDFNQAVTATGRLSSSNPKSAKHSRSHGIQPSHPQSVPPPRGLDTAQRRLLPNRTPNPHPPLRGRGAAGGLQHGRRRARTHRTLTAG
jgi:DNA polymerase-1